MSRRGPNAVIYVAVTVMLLIAAGFVYRSRPLVVLATDHSNQAIVFTTLDLAPGASTATTETLTNRGLLPLTYTLEPSTSTGTPIPAAYQLQVKRLPDGPTLYSGPLQHGTGALGTLNPNQSVRLEVTISTPRDQAPQQGTHLPADLTLRWSGRAGVSSSTLLVLFEAFLVLAVLAIAGRWGMEVRSAAAATTATHDLSRRL